MEYNIACIAADADTEVRGSGYAMQTFKFLKKVYFTLIDENGNKGETLSYVVSRFGANGNEDENAHLSTDPMFHFDNVLADIMNMARKEGVKTAFLFMTCDSSSSWDTYNLFSNFVRTFATPSIGPTFHDVNLITNDPLYRARIPSISAADAAEHFIPLLSPHMKSYMTSVVRDYC